MGKEIFVSYKYADTDVKNITGVYYPADKVRDYVDYLEKKIAVHNIYKGEHDGEDMSSFTDDTIWTKLKDKIFYSSVTIVLISKNMKDFGVKDSEQWIPWEISYSLKEMSRNDGSKKSLPNAILCIVLPDRVGSYDYYINNKNFLLPYNSSLVFDVINNNMNNNKNNIFDSYIVTVKWDDFIRNINYYVDLAVDKQNHIDEYKITKNV